MIIKLVSGPHDAASRNLLCEVRDVLRDMGLHRSISPLGDHDPGVIFIPTDLQYFIDFELDDRKRRSTTSSVLDRKVPTSVMHKTI